MLVACEFFSIKRQRVEWVGRPERKTTAEVDPELRVFWARPSRRARSCGTWQRRNRWSVKVMIIHQKCLLQQRSTTKKGLVQDFKKATSPQLSVAVPSQWSSSPTLVSIWANSIMLSAPHFSCANIYNYTTRSDQNLCNGLVKGIAPAGVRVVWTIELLNLGQVCWLEDLQNT